MYVQPEFDVVRSINKTASDKRDAAAIPSQWDENIFYWPNGLHKKRNFRVCLGFEKQVGMLIIIIYIKVNFRSSGT